MKVADVHQTMVSLLNQIGKNESIQLTPGQIVSVFLKQVQGDMALLKYQGVEILAKLEAEVPVGTRLQCLVEGERNGQMVLKVLTGGQDNNTQTLKNAANQLGLASDSRNLTILSEMIKQEMPLTPDSSRRISAFARKLDIPQEDLGLTVFMHQQGIPLTKTNYINVRGLLNDMKFLQADLTQLVKGIQTAMVVEDPATELGQLLKVINQGLKGFQVTGSDGAETIASKMAAVNLVLTPEMGRAGQELKVQEGKVPAASPVLQDKDGDAPGQKAASSAQALPSQGGQLNLTGKGPGTLSVQVPADQTQETRSVPPNELKGNIGNLNLSPGEKSGAAIEQRQGGEHADQIKKDVIGRLSGLMDQENNLTGMTKEQVLSQVHKVFENNDNAENVKNLMATMDKLVSSLGEKGGNEHKELARLAQNMMDKVDVIQNFNLRTEPGRHNTMVVYSSVRFDTQEEPLRLMIKYRQESKGKGRDFSTCKVEVRLNTPGLGPVKCEVQVNQKNISLQFTTTNELAGKLIEKSQGILAQRLDAMRYVAKVLPCKIEENENMETGSDEKSTIPGLFQINLRV